ncbi:Ca(2+)-dependent cysteine protease, partial [Gonapodya sp. JEL0774]
MKWLVKDAQRGDSLFFHYSGHGGSTQDQNGDEADGNDETIVPVDYESAGQITDDEIFEIMVKPLPEVVDLPYTYTADGNLDVVQFDNRLPAARNMLRQGVIDRANPNDAVTQLFGGTGAFAGGGPGNNAASMTLTPQQIQQLVQKRASYGTVIQFAGCADKQTSADASIGGQKTGAASWAFMQ